MEIVLLIAACVLMYRIADADDNGSPLIWAVATFLFGLATVFFLPMWPFVRVGLAVVLAFVGMIVWNVVAEN